MSAIPFLPPARPRLTLALALSRVAVPVNLEEVTVLGFRGYYHVDENDNERGKYDDAVAIVGPEHWSTYNYNTDPSAHRQGIATLTAGDWRYKPGIHGLSKPKAHQYAAFVQAGPVQVRRDQAATDPRRSDLRNVDRRNRTGQSDGDTAQKARKDEVPEHQRDGCQNRGDDKEHRRQKQHLLAPKPVADETGDGCAEHTPQGDRADRDTQLARGQREVAGDEGDRARNHRDVKTEQESADRRNKRNQIDIT